MEHQTKSKSYQFLEPPSLSIFLSSSTILNRPARPLRQVESTSSTSSSPSHPSVLTMSVAGPSTKPVSPHYCGVCSLPTEYCEFGPSFSKCKTWLEGKDREEYERLWGAGELRDTGGCCPIPRLVQVKKVFRSILVNPLIVLRLADRPDRYAVGGEAGEARGGRGQG